MAGRIKRKFMAHFINASTSGTDSYVRLGSGIEEYSIEMNANVETTTDINGENPTILDSYKPQVSIGPYYAVDGDAMFERLQTIVDERQTLDDLKVEVVEVHLWKIAVAGGYTAYREEGIVEVVSYGGDTKGYQIPFNVHYVGNRVKGIFNPTTKTFTADSEGGEG